MAYLRFLVNELLVLECGFPHSVIIIYTLLFIIHNLVVSCLYGFLRDVDITERLDYSSAIAVIGFSLIVSILRTFDVRVEAARVMVSAPVLAFVTTHILYINFYKLDYGTLQTLLKPIQYDFSFSHSW